MAEEVMNLRRNVRLLDVVVAIGILWLIWLAYFKLTDSPDDYFIVNKVYVEDHVEGSNPTLIYDRTIKKAFQGLWQADVKSVDLGIVVCVARGSHNYEPTEKIVSRDLDWYLERTCPIRPGEYLVTTTWQIGRTGMEVTNTSNVFRVYSRGDWDDHQRAMNDQKGRDADRRIELGPPPPPFPRPNPTQPPLRDKRPIVLDKGVDSN